MPSRASRSAPSPPRVRVLLLIAMATCIEILRAIVSLPLAAAEPPVEYSPSAADDFPTRVLWGDTHVHSSFSMDANTMGNTRLGPADAYRFARGEAVQAHNGMTVRLEVPLDFLLVSDHAEYMGLLPALRAKDPTLLADPVGRALYEGIQGDEQTRYDTIARLIGSLMTSEPLIENESFERSIWSEITRIADQYDDPGRFTTLIGFEWSPIPKGDNLHRVVVYRDGAERAARKIPVSSFDDERPEALWDFMDAYSAETGGQILAIPHNPNMSNGRMFATRDSAGRPFDRAYAERRARLEPIAEVTQVKGDSETHPLLSPDDEFADFERWDRGNIGVPSTPKQDGMLQWEYARQALLHGLGEAARTGANPFAFGMIGSTDSHTSLATAAENDFWGKLVSFEPSRHRIGPPRIEVAGEERHEGKDEGGRHEATYGWSFVASGYAAVWAHQNTRASIFDAMRRREVYATTGSRITLRFFGGWDFDDQDAARPDAVRLGYRKGVPMGSELADRDGAGAPRFLVSAQRDPNGANLDRIQIVKGWRTPDGELHERVHDVALGGEGRRGWLGGVKPVRSTVDLATATYTNSVGAAELTATWEDPVFDPQSSAFYYVRVIEIPTPRWSLYDVVRLGASHPEAAPKTLQDRAYSSPIWYTPRRSR